jgi:mRNA interferase RelE/StbE
VNDYNLVYTRRAEKDIRALDPAIKRQIGKAILKLQSNPTEQSEKLTNPGIGTYRFRTGDYRVIFDLVGNDLVILRVGHRKEIYRKI